MLKKIIKVISIFVLFFLFYGNIFSYFPNESDVKLVNKINNNIDKIYKIDSTKIDKIYLKIKKIKYIKSLRIKYIFSNILSHIDYLKKIDVTINKYPDFVYKSPSITNTGSKIINNSDSNNNSGSNYINLNNGSVLVNDNWDNFNFKNIYEVGPGKTYTELNQIPWNTLQKSSIIKINWREKPYYSKFVVNVAGTKSEPVVVIGIPNNEGKLPIISGNGAITPSELDYWNEERSIIKIGGSSKPINDMPSYIYIENLDIMSANPSYSFTDDSGNKKYYVKNAAGVHIEYGDNITIKNCNIHDNGNGIFTTHLTSNILIAGNYIYDNGIVGSIYEHNTYTESIGITYEYNRFGKLKIGASGNNLKDRSSNTVIRYNFIEGGNRQLDLVDSDYQELITANNYQKTYVYGNILVEPSDDNGNSQFIHYGGDSGNTENYRNGTLYLYNNTFVSYRNSNPTLIRMSLNKGKSEIINNIFVVKDGTSLAITNGEGQINLNNNYLPENWKNTFEYSFNGTINQSSNIIGNKPGFIDLNSMNFNLINNADVRNKSMNLLNNSFFKKVEYQYLKDKSIIKRITTNDIGAYEYSN